MIMSTGITHHMIAWWSVTRSLLRAGSAGVQLLKCCIGDSSFLFLCSSVTHSYWIFPRFLFSWPIRGVNDRRIAVDR